jgi:hypothetical protein
MGHPLASTAGQAKSASVLQRLSHWLTDTINHAWGNPGEEAQHRPPAIGVQPYSDPPSRRRRR